MEALQSSSLSNQSLNAFQMLLRAMLFSLCFHAYQFKSFKTGYLHCLSLLHASFLFLG